MHGKMFEGLNAVLSAILAIVVSLLLCALLLLSQGVDPIKTFSSIFYGAFGGIENFGASLVATTPLLIASLGVILAYRAGVWNIGVEGQVFLGAMAGTWVGTSFSGLPTFIHLPFALAASMAAGVLWALIPAYMKISKGFNEVITTMLMNYIAAHFLSYAVHGPLKDPNTFAPQSPAILSTAELPRIFQGTEFHAGFFIGFALVVFCFIFLYKTDWGYRLRVVGFNPEAGKTAGMNSKRIILSSMLMSGALAGLAGGVEILGNQRILLENFGVNIGYNAIAVALLGGLDPIGAFFASIFMGALKNGAIMMQIFMRLPLTLIYVIQSIIILSILSFSTRKIIRLDKIYQREERDIA